MRILIFSVIIYFNYRKGSAWVLLIITILLCSLGKIVVDWINLHFLSAQVPAEWARPSRETGRMYPASWTTAAGAQLWTSLIWRLQLEIFSGVDILFSSTRSAEPTITWRLSSLLRTSHLSEPQLPNRSSESRGQFSPDLNWWTFSNYFLSNIQSYFHHFCKWMN